MRNTSHAAPSTKDKFITACGRTETSMTSSGLKRHRQTSNPKEREKDTGIESSIGEGVVGTSFSNLRDELQPRNIYRDRRNSEREG